MSDDEIFCAALELDAEENRSELVRSLCAGNPEQLERVEQLLKTHRKLQGGDEDSQSILDRPDVVFRTFSDAEELMPGKQVGKYVLCEQIGEGATSLVFRALQKSPVERTVALKILKPGMDSQRVLARFGLEHQVINRLEHPGVSSIFDVGVHDSGRPFFAMELIPDALTIIQYAEQFKLELDRRIRLVIAACEVVQHAHQRGIIHRDLKPSNILMEGIAQVTPKPHIIDFGIAKVLQPGDDSHSFTTLGDRFGTPAYMSPEQALSSAGSLDIRSDVYSLGVILYELLTGATPRQASGNAASDLLWTSEAYWKYETKPPSRIFGVEIKPKNYSPRELDLIVLKAIARERQDRYQTVADLQRDLQRFLNGEPVEAAGTSFLYRAQKVIYRNRAVSLATALSLLTIVVTSILTASYAFRANKAEKQVRLQLQETLETQQKLVVERDRAEAAMRQSQSLLRVFQVQSATDQSFARFLQDVLQRAQRGQIDGQSMDFSSMPLQVEVLTQPHKRLIVRGDWQWASSRFPSEIINTSFQISSQEAAQALPMTRQHAQPDERMPSNDGQSIVSDSNPNAAEDRDSLQRILLEELRKILPTDDPFIAEVLDNCGLQALDRNDLIEASRFLSESVVKWGKTDRYPANLAQSQLFLAEALMRQSRHKQAASMLNQARQSLDLASPDSAHYRELLQFSNRLQTQLQNAK